MSSLVDLDDQEFDEDNPPPSKKGKGTAVGKCLRFLKELLIVIVYSCFRKQQKTDSKI